MVAEATVRRRGWGRGATVLGALCPWVAGGVLADGARRLSLVFFFEPLKIEKWGTIWLPHG